MKQSKKEFNNIKLEDSVLSPSKSIRNNNEDIPMNLTPTKKAGGKIMEGLGDVMPLPAFQKISKCVIQQIQVDTDS